MDGMSRCWAHGNEDKDPLKSDERAPYLHLRQVQATLGAKCHPLIQHCQTARWRIATSRHLR